ncbi:S-layer homology domain-containing protein [Gorillibacterium sp. sgz5001074]|uniref:S-layer homology domain-containing protein n=1 Tax=Gorillibacterium sp. sgz5001074 TaxID=3446695 RepID=UPI003F665F11
MLMKRMAAGLAAISLLSGLVSPSYWSTVALADGRPLAPMTFGSGAADPDEAQTVTKQLGMLEFSTPSVHQSVYQTAGGGAGQIVPPVMDALPKAVTNQPSVTVTGTAPANSAVTILYKVDGGDLKPGASAVATGEGRFSTLVDLPSEGHYEIFATAKIHDMVSGESNVLTLEVDRTAPSYPEYVSWSNPSYDKIELKWGAADPNQGVDHYLVQQLDKEYHVLKTAETKLPYYMETDLPELTYAYYDIYSVDKAGNRSEYAYSVEASTFHKNADLIARAADTSEGKESFWSSVLSRDGSTVAFVSDQKDLAGSPPPNAGDYSLYVYRLETKKMLRIGDIPFSTYNLEVPFSLSADGRYVVYSTAEDDNGSELMVYDTADGSSKSLVHIRGSADALSLSDDGSRLVFSSYADHLVDGDTNNQSDVFLLHRPTGKITRVSVGIQQEQSNGSSVHPAISGDGRWVSFMSESTNLVEGDFSRDYNRVYLYDVEAGATRLVSLHNDSSDEMSGDEPHVSRDGAIVAYVSSYGNEEKHVYVWDRATGKSQSVREFPSSLDISMSHPRVSADGRYVMMDYHNTNRSHSGSGPFDSTRGAMRYDRTTGDLQHVGSRARSTVSSDISADGRRAAFVVNGAEVYAVCFEACGQTQPQTAIDHVGWYAEPSVSGFPLAGGNIFIQAYGTKGQQLQAAVTYKTRSGSPGFKIIPLAAADPAATLYSGSFQLEEDAVEVTSIRARSLTNGSVVKDAEALPVAVAGTLKVQIQTDPSYMELLHNVNLVLWSEEKRYGGSARLTDPVRPVELGLGPADDYTLRIMDASGRLLVEKNGIQVKAGVETELTAEVKPAAELLIKVNSAEVGQQNLYGVTVDLLANGGEVLGSWKTDTKGEAAFAGNYWAGDAVTVRITAPAPYVNPPETKLTLTPGVNSRTFTLEQVTYGELRGKVTRPDGSPAEGVRVLLLDPAGIETVRETWSDASGHYVLRANARNYLVQAERSQPPLLRSERAQPVTLLAQGTVTKDMVLLDRGPGTILLNTLLKPVDGDWRPIEMPDWRSGAHYGLEAKGENPNFYGKAYEVQNNLLPVVAGPGEKVTVCMKGHEAGLQSACDEVVLDDYRNGVAELKLEERARITGKIVGETSYTGFHVIASRINGGTGGYYRGVEVDASGRFAVSLPESGRVELIVRSDVGPDSYNGNYYSTTVEVTEGQLLELPDIRLPGDALFYGRPDNGLNVQELVASGGSTVTLRGTYKLTRRQQGELLQEGYLGIEVPAGARFVEGSAMLNGTPVETSLAGGKMRIPVGGIPYNQSGTFSYRLKLNAKVESDLMAKVNIGYTGTQGHKEELLGSAWIRVPLLTLEAPERTASHTVKLSGRAAAGQGVTLYADDRTVGRAQASAGGLWYTSVTLPEKGGVWNDTSVYSLLAKADTEEGTVQSKPVSVSVNAEHALFKKITMFQTFGGRASFNPADGVARFPFVIVPGEPLFFELESLAPERVKNVKIKLGERETDAFYNVESGKFHAVMSTPSTNMGAGLYVTYDELTKPPVYKPSPTEEAWRSEHANMPEQWGTASYELLDPASGENPFPEQAGLALDDYVHSPTVKIKFNAGQSQETAYYRVSAKAVTLPGGSNGGAYPDFSVDVNESAGTIVMQGTVPVSLLVQSGQGDAVRALLGPAEVEEAGGITFKNTFRVAGALNNLRKYVTDGFDFAEYADQLLAFQDYVINNECHSPTVNSYLRETERLFDRAKTNLIIKNATTGLALVAGTLTLAIPPVGGIALGIGLAVMGEMAKNKWQEELNDLKARFEEEKKWRDDMAEAGAIERCERDEEDDDHDPDEPPHNEPPKTADPTWIWDPSGYVYEAFRDNRIEGVTATILKQEADGGWRVWDSEWYGQKNPLVSDPQGKYGWDVPEGKWQVLFEKPGYLPARSPELTVLPPHLDVNIPMTSLEPPQVAVIDAVYGTGVRVLFNKYMLADSITGAGMILETTAGERIPTAVEAVDAKPGDGQGLLAKQFLLVPGRSVEAGVEMKVTVKAGAASYARVPMEQDYSAEVTLKGADAPAAEAAEALQAVQGRRQLGVQWTKKATIGLEQYRLYWRIAQSGAAFQEPVTVPVGQTSYVLEGLSAGTAYELKLTSVMEDGRESVGLTVEGRTVEEAPLVMDTVPAGAVQDASAQPEKSAVTVSWTDPADRDLRKVLVSWKKHTDARYSMPMYVDPGVQHLRIAGLEPSTGYDLKLVSADRYWNVSDEVKLAVSTTGEGSEPDRTPPQEVSGGAVRDPAAQGFTVTWTDPADTDLKEIRIAVSKAADGAVFGDEAVVAKGAMQYRVSGLESGTRYRIRLIAVDASGNRSSGLLLEGSTASSGSSGGSGEEPSGNGSGTPGGGGVPGPNGNPGGEQPPVKVTLSPEGGQWEGYNGSIRIKYGAGAFTEGARLSVPSLRPDRVPTGYTAFSKAFRLELESGRMTKPVQLILKYDPLNRPDWDPRLLALYREDASLPGGWVYAGGVVKSSGHTVEADILQPGTYILMVYGKGFLDLRGHWAERDIAVLVSRHIIDGKTEITFAPEEGITRAEFTKLLVQLLQGPGSGGLPAVTEAPFEDVDASEWYAPYIAWAEDKGLVQGDGGRFRPDEVLTRQELAVLIVRALGLEADAREEERQLAADGAVPDFADGRDIPAWAAGYVETARKNGLMQGIGGGRFEPELTAGRAQGAVLVLRAMVKLGLLGE